MSGGGLGMIVRSENVGVGVQTFEMYRHLEPDRVLVVDMRNVSKRSGHHYFERYPDAWRVVPMEELDGRTWVDFVRGLDAVYTAETPYEYGLYVAAQDARCRTVTHVNPEFHRHTREPDLPRPDVVVLPTIWREGKVPHHVVLPTPVDRERVPFEQRREARTFLHVAGQRATGDRNGTQLVLQTARHVTAPVEFVIRSQARLSANSMRARGRHTRIVAEVENLPDYPEVTAGADVLVLPRRYAGQCLQINEALSRGMPVVCLDRSPENTWPGTWPVECYRQRRMRSQAGVLDVVGAIPRNIAAAIDELAESPGLVAELSDLADAHASSISWTALRDDWVAVLEGRLDDVEYRPPREPVGVEA